MTERTKAGLLSLIVCRAALIGPSTEVDEELRDLEMELRARMVPDGEVFEGCEVFAAGESNECGLYVTLMLPEGTLMPLPDTAATLVVHYRGAGVTKV